MAKKGIYRNEIFEAWCKRCGICVAFCPEGVLEMDQENKPLVVRPENCTGCGLCEIRCPDFAISVQVKDQQYEKAANPEAKATPQVESDDKQASTVSIENIDLNGETEDSH